MKQILNVKNLLIGILVLYTAALLYLLFFLPVRQNVVGGNLVPFHTIKRYKQQHELFKLQLPTNHGIEAQIYGNILLFVPLAILLPILFPRFRNPLLTVCLIFGLSLGVETIQRVFRIGQFDVDDVILNGTGGILGIIIFIILDWSSWEYKKRKLTVK